MEYKVFATIKDSQVKYFKVPEIAKVAYGGDFIIHLEIGGRKITPKSISALEAEFLGFEPVTKEEITSPNIPFFDRGQFLESATDPESSDNINILLD